MCGFAGFLGFGRLGPDSAEAVATRMGSALRHRGPDDSGIWCDAGAEVALAHRRLSILDLSAAGHQPMSSPTGRFVIAFNGEIYNHLELREQLASMRTTWLGHSDTETLLAGFELWGVTETVRRLVGMFAFAVWDRERREMTLARDRAGEKPLYYGSHGGVTFFGSELKALRAHPAFTGEVDRQAVWLQLHHNYIPAPHSIFRGIRKLPPGTLVRIPAEGRSGAQDLPPAAPYWSWTDTMRNRVTLADASPQELVSCLDTLLRQAVKRQMLSDVPLGAFLSGGIDSSTVVALMQAQSAQPVRTFSIGFHEAEYDEAVHARAVAQHLGTQHTEFYVTPQDAMSIIDSLPEVYDEPFSDSSQIPTLLLCGLARRHVTVALSGDAGDELFGGYSRYFKAARVWRTMSRVPHPVRRLSASVIRNVPVAVWNGLTRPAHRLLPMRGRNVGDKAHKAAELMGHRDRMFFYDHLNCHWASPEGLVVGDVAVERRPSRDDLALAYEEEMMLADAESYLPDDILVKVDRAAMAHSLETRIPMLDHSVIEFAGALPLSVKMRSGEGKWILRQVLDRYVPKALVDRPKMGFGVPVGSWLRGPLREWAEDLLNPVHLREQGFLDPSMIHKKWTEHLSGSRNWQYHLWDVLMFQQWLRHQAA